MDELLPYEQQLAGKLANLPLPDEDKGWNAMRKMLDDDDDDGGIIPPVNRGCRIWGAMLLLIVLVAGIVTITWKKHTVNQTDFPHKTATLKDSGLAAKPNVGIDTMAVTGKLTPIDVIVDTLQKPGTNNKHAGGTPSSAQQYANRHAVKPYSYKGVAVNSNKKQALQTGNTRFKNSAAKTLGTGVAQPLASADAPTGVTNSTAISQPRNNTGGAVPANGKNETTGKDTIEKNDTTGKTLVTNTDTTRYNKNSNQNNLAQTDDNNDKVWFGAGLALQQLIPVNGQKAVPYSSSGRKGSLGDYIPSAYFRLYHKRKFLQVEFKYGAPQYTRDVAYQKTVISTDSSSGISVANVNHVKKTYYHQLPVSIHYIPVPNLSIGAGVVWNKFQSAVVEQQTRSFRGNVEIDSGGAAIPSKLLTLNSDSATSFSKSYLQFMVEAQYNWRRFSFGARYAFGLQPYLTFTSPATGQQQNEKNASLNIFIRYELWRSKKK